MLIATIIALILAIIARVKLNNAVEDYACTPPTWDKEIKRTKGEVDFWILTCSAAISVTSILFTLWVLKCLP